MLNQKHSSFLEEVLVGLDDPEGLTLLDTDPVRDHELSEPHSIYQNDPRGDGPGELAAPVARTAQVNSSFVTSAVSHGHQEA